MKKLLFLGVVAGLGYLVWREISAEKADRDLWQEITDPLEG